MQYKNLNNEIYSLTNKKSGKQLALWASICAERVLPIYERFCDDERVRVALTNAQLWAYSLIEMSEARASSNEVYNLTKKLQNDKAALLAAQAAGHAAATAYVNSHAIIAANYALKALEATGATVEEIEEEQILQLETLKNLKEL